MGWGWGWVVLRANQHRPRLRSFFTYCYDYMLLMPFSRASILGGRSKEDKTTKKANGHRHRHQQVPHQFWNLPLLVGGQREYVITVSLFIRHVFT